MKVSLNRNRILSSTMVAVINNIFVLQERLNIIDKLSAYNCTKWCVDLQISEITRVTGKTMENLKGNPDRITVLDLQNAVVQTLEDIYCFNMTEIEQRVGIRYQILNESQWAFFVPGIVKAAVKCKADILGVSESELAELLHTTLPSLYAYTLDEVKNSFFPNVLRLQTRKNVFETRSLNEAYVMAGLTREQGEAETMLYYAGQSEINFNLRHLEILYGWQKPQLFAIESIPLSSYLSQCNDITSNSLLVVSTELFGQGITQPTCTVAYVLSRSLNEVDAKYSFLTLLDLRNALYIFTSVTNISSWFVMDGILQLSVDEGIWVSLPTVSHVASAAGHTIKFMKTCSLPQVIAILKSVNATGALGPFLTISSPAFRNFLLLTYGYTYHELISLGGSSLAQLSNLPVVELHATILDALVERYSISNLSTLPGVPGDVDMHVLSTLPPFEWPRIVLAVVQASFAHAADALSVNLTAGSHIAVTQQTDGNPSIAINPSPVFLFPRVSTNTLATCLRRRNETDVYGMTLSMYHALFKDEIIPIVYGKITIEGSPLENLLANDSLLLRQVWNRTVAEVVEKYTGLTVQQFGCLYGWNPVLNDLSSSITWGDVSASRLCNDYETLPLHQILVQLSTAPVVNCWPQSNPSSSSPSDSTVAVTISVIIAVVILIIVLVIARVVYYRYRKSHQRPTTENIQNTAYEGDMEATRKELPNVSESGVYEEPVDYAQLDSSKRDPVCDGNYQSLMPVTNNNA